MERSETMNSWKWVLSRINSAGKSLLTSFGVSLSKSSVFRKILSGSTLETMRNVGSVILKRLNVSFNTCFTLKWVDKLYLAGTLQFSMNSCSFSVGVALHVTSLVVSIAAFAFSGGSRSPIVGDGGDSFDAIVAVQRMVYGDRV
jgi:hypothetical protein